jgi:hypothetical protein
MKLGAQETLDELFVESLVPFKLWARQVESLGMEEYKCAFMTAGYAQSMFPGNQTKHSRQFFAPPFWVELRDFRDRSRCYVLRARHNLSCSRVLHSLCGLFVPNPSVEYRCRIPSVEDGMYNATTATTQSGLVV